MNKHPGVNSRFTLSLLICRCGLLQILGRHLYDHFHTCYGLCHTFELTILQLNTILYLSNQLPDWEVFWNYHKNILYQYYLRGQPFGFYHRIFPNQLLTQRSELGLLVPVQLYNCTLIATRCTDWSVLDIQEVTQQVNLFTTQQ